MSIPHFIEVVEDQPADVLAREHNRFLKVAYEEIGEHWFKELLPDHFRHYSAAKYNFQTRSTRYKQRKEALARAGVSDAGGALDLVLTGASRDQMLGQARISASKARATVTVDTPFYFPLRRNAAAPDKAAEVLRLIPSQQRSIEERAGQRYDEQLGQYRYMRKYLIKP